jgi:membrane protease YdiL (CAAX protease family)
MLPLVWLASGTPAFQKTYPLLKEAETSAFLFFGYHGYYLLKWTAWEFFFRGFMLFGFKHDIGGRAVLISTLPFVIIHMNKPEAEMLGSIIAGFALCWIALRSKSIWPGVMIHWLVAMAMDFFASSWWH